ncbi:MAG: hypothetical protein JSR44_09500 [Spirochaetes bacterium]|nr:hypothetical protein [Spirochaetota bacterium]
MASILLSEVPDPTDLRDLISREWGEYRSFRSDAPPADLRSTSWHDEGNNSPSHRSGRAIDVVTDSWADRGYLFEFGLWLALRYEKEQLNVIYYKRAPQPHLHVAFFSGRVGKAEASIGFCSDGTSKYNYYFPPYAKSAAAILSEIIDYEKTYTENTAQWDKAKWLRILKGLESPPWQGGFFNTIIGYLKKYWWALLIPIVIAVPLVIYFRSREE